MARPCERERAGLCVRFLALSFTSAPPQDACADGDWNVFNEKVLAAAPEGNLVLKWVVPEITPPVRPGQYLFRPNGARVDALGSDKAEFERLLCRGLIEGQMQRLRHHAAALGLEASERIVATGGAAANPVVLQIMANVFGVKVFVSTRNTHSAALGGCYRALHTYQRTRGAYYSFESATAHLDADEEDESGGDAHCTSLQLAATPDMELHAAVYEPQARLYTDCISQVIDGFYAKGGK